MQIGNQSCVCHPDGQLLCYKNCKHPSGEPLRHSNEKRISCSQCTCYNGTLDCTEQVCRSCQRRGDVFTTPHGYSIEVKCRICKCNDGRTECKARNTCSPFEDQFRCVLNNIAYKSNIVFSALGCSECRCVGREVLCNSESCGSSNKVQKREKSAMSLYKRDNCEQDGHVYADGDQFNDNCNTCFCHEGSAVCTGVLCPGMDNPQEIDDEGQVAERELKDERAVDEILREMGLDKRRTGRKGCNFKGNRYRHGESFKDACNSCSCFKGNVYCGNKSCPV